MQLQDLGTIRNANIYENLKAYKDTKCKRCLCLWWLYIFYGGVWKGRVRNGMGKKMGKDEEGGRNRDSLVNEKAVI